MPLPFLMCTKTIYDAATSFDNDPHCDRDQSAGLITKTTWTMILIAIMIEMFAIVSSSFWPTCSPFQLTMLS
jgi:hypothetical protein